MEYPVQVRGKLTAAYKGVCSYLKIAPCDDVYATEEIVRRDKKSNGGK